MKSNIIKIGLALNTKLIDKFKQLEGGTKFKDEKIKCYKGKPSLSSFLNMALEDFLEKNENERHLYEDKELFHGCSADDVLKGTLTDQEYIGYLKGSLLREKLIFSSNKESVKDKNNRIKDYEIELKKMGEKNG